MRTPVNGGVPIGSHFNKNTYMHEQTTIEFGVRIVNRKNLNWWKPFSDVSLCSMRLPCGTTSGTNNSATRY